MRVVAHPVAHGALRRRDTPACALDLSTAPGHPCALGTHLRPSPPSPRRTIGQRMRSRGLRPRNRSRGRRYAHRVSLMASRRVRAVVLVASQAVICACRWPRPFGGTAILMRRQVGQRQSLETKPISRGTDTSNPAPSSGESTNFRFLSRRRRLFDRMPWVEKWSPIWCWK